MPTCRMKAAVYPRHQAGPVSDHQVIDDLKLRPRQAEYADLLDAEHDRGMVWYTFAAETTA